MKTEQIVRLWYESLLAYDDYTITIPNLNTLIMMLESKEDKEIIDLSGLKLQKDWK